MVASGVRQGAMRGRTEQKQNRGEEKIQRQLCLMKSFSFAPPPPAPPPRARRMSMRRGVLLKHISPLKASSAALDLALSGWSALASSRYLALNPSLDVP